MYMSSDKNEFLIIKLSVYTVYFIKSTKNKKYKK